MSSALIRGYYLEVKLQSELNLSRIARREELSKLADRRETRDVVEGRIRRQPIRNGLEDVVKERLVEDVEELGAELKPVSLRHAEVLRQIEIRKELAWEAERRSWRVSNLSRERSPERKRVECVRNAARWIGRNIVQRIADDVRTSTAGGYRCRILDHAIQRQSCLGSSDARDFPAAQERAPDTRTRKPGMERWHLVDVTRNEYMCTIKSRDGAFEMIVGANLRHVDRVAIVSRVSNVLRERVRKLRSDTTRRTQAE